MLNFHIYQIKRKEAKKIYDIIKMNHSLIWTEDDQAFITSFDLYNSCLLMDDNVC